MELPKPAPGDLQRAGRCLACGWETTEPRRGQPATRAIANLRAALHEHIALEHAERIA
jgi:hypothetical protein